MEKNIWKVVAIIFIILFILETSIFFFLLNLGKKEIDNDTKCRMDICVNEADSDGYYYESPVCYCYGGNEIIYQKVLT
jgi:hypothetical protein